MLYSHATGLTHFNQNDYYKALNCTGGDIPAAIDEIMQSVVANLVNCITVK